MRKFLAITLALMLLALFTGCAKQEGNSSAETTETTKTAETTESTSAPPVSVDENLLTVEVNLAASLFQGKEPEAIIATAKENGILECVINEDGSVTYTMTKARHKEMLEELEASMRKLSDDLVNGESKIDSFLEITNNEDFSEFNVYVDGEKYTSFDSFNSIVFYTQGLYYQSYLGRSFDEMDIIVNYIDSETGELLNQGSYRKLAENSETTQAQ